MDSTKNGLCIAWAGFSHLARIPMWLRIRCIILLMQEYSFDSQANSLFGGVWPENCFMKKS